MKSILLWQTKQIDLLQSLQRNLRVNLCGLDVLVAEDLLDVTDIGSVLVHVRRHAVPQEMARPHFAELRGLDMLPHHPRQMIAADRLAFGREKHREVVGIKRKLGRTSRMYFCNHPIARSPMGT